MNFLYQLIGTPLGWIFWAMYQVIANYGIDIIIFTVLLKLVQFPLAVKQQKASAKMGAFQPLIQEINKKYANNPKKKNEELQKIYTEEGYNPMGGCLPTILQFVFLFGILDVVYRPLTHILHLGSDVINQAIEIAGLNQANLTSQLGVVQQLQQDPGKFSALGDSVVSSIQNMNMSFLGMNLGDKPVLASITVLIPILAGVFSFLSIFLSMKTNPAMTSGAPGMGTSSVVMMIVMPIFSLWIAFNFPIGVGIYWIISYIVMIVQTLVIYKMYDLKELREQATAELMERRKKKKSKVVVKEVVEKDKDGNEVVRQKKMTQKEIDRQRLAEARKRDAEKYGETYVEVTDEDFK